MSTKVEPTSVNCGDCNAILNERSDFNPLQRQPCYNCGSVKRHFSVGIEETLGVHLMIGAKAKHPKQRPFLEQKIGDDLHKKSNTWMSLERVIDRAKNWYKEIIVNPKTGEIIHKIEEPLSDHTDHGSAKKRK